MAVASHLLARLGARFGHQGELLGPALALTRLDSPRQENGDRPPLIRQAK
jgi:hypothetical protein